MATDSKWLAAHGMSCGWTNVLQINAHDKRDSAEIWMEAFPEESNFRVLPGRFDTADAAAAAARDGADQYAK